MPPHPRPLHWLIADFDAWRRMACCFLHNRQTGLNGIVLPQYCNYANPKEADKYNPMNQRSIYLPRFYHDKIDTWLHKLNAPLTDRRLFLKMGVPPFRLPLASRPLALPGLPT